MPRLPYRSTIKEGTMEMRKVIFGAAGVLALTTPAMASDLPATPYSEVHRYEREADTYEYRTAPPAAVIEEQAPVVSERVIVQRPAVVEPPPVVVEEYPIYPAPRLYAAPPVYAYAGPGWHHGWRHRRYFGAW
jgi:hypothetical protein